MAYTLATAAEAGGVSWLVVLWGIRSGCIAATRGENRDYRIDEDDLRRGLDRLARRAGRAGSDVGTRDTLAPATSKAGLPEHGRAARHAVPGPCRSSPTGAAKGRARGLRLVGGTDVAAH